MSSPGSHVPSGAWLVQVSDGGSVFFQQLLLYILEHHTSKPAP